MRPVFFVPISLFVKGTLPHPNIDDCSENELLFSSDLSSVLGRSKLSILYPVIKSGSSSLTNLVSPSMISFSEPINS